MQGTYFKMLFFNRLAAKYTTITQGIYPANIPNIY